MAMTPSLRTLLTGIIDYAGLFPPAKLSLEQAIRNYARYRQEDEGWMLGRFVIPARRLAELGPFQDELFSAGPPLALSILGPGDPSWAECRRELDETLRSLKTFRQRHGGRTVTDVLEMKVPKDLVEASDPRATARGLTNVAAVIEAAGCSDLTVFFEFGFDEGEESVATVLDALALANRGASRRAGFKLRCGGLEASAFPTAAQIALVIRHAVLNRVPWKATAGLHHPLPHLDAGVGTKMHGFVNVFAAGVLGYARHVEPSMLVRLLQDEDPAHFRFDDSGFRHGVLHATTAEIAAARQEGVLSFGTCSFEEPRDDLRALGWL